MTNGASYWALGFFIANKMGMQIPAHISLLLTIAVNVYLYGAIPKGFFPDGRKAADRCRARVWQ